MHLRLVSGRGGSLLAEHYTRDVGKALEVADKLKATGLRPNIVRSGPNYVVYIATTDLLRLAERDETIRKAIALYLTEKAKNGTPRQREIAEKILKRHPFFHLRLDDSLEEMVARPGFESRGSPPGPRGPEPRIPSRVFLWPLDDRARTCFIELVLNFSSIASLFLA